MAAVPPQFSAFPGRPEVGEAPDGIEDVPRPYAVVTNRTIDVHVAVLRKKLGNASALIQTVCGVGYTLRPLPGVGQ